MFDDYLENILAAYEKSKNEGTLSPHLSSPTPGSLREECLLVYRKRYNSLDDGTLRLFFEFSDKEKSYSRGIENFKTDGFKQIPKILRRGINNPGIKYIELIAWLIDFQPRPSPLYYKKPGTNNTAVNPEKPPIEEKKKEEPDPPLPEEPNDNAPKKQDDPNDTNKDNTKGNDGQTSENTDNPKDPINEKPPSKFPLSSQSVILIAIVLLLVGGGTFFFQKNKTAGLNNKNNQKCMYWAGDHYEPTDCDKKISDVPVIPLNNSILNNFKKITLPDTLTKNDIGKIWYTSKSRKHEFFTGSGMHPTDTTRRLKPLTPYILANHVSYHRYLLNILIYSFSVLIMAIICAVCLICFRKKRKNTI